jgi:transcriptional regulator with XRE-family HTH domain
MMQEPRARIGRTLDAAAFGRIDRDPEFEAELARISLPMEIANTVTAARGRRHMSQDQLAVRVEMTPSAISQIESGRQLPGRDTLRLLSVVLGVTFPSPSDEDADAIEAAMSLSDTSRATSASEDIQDEWTPFIEEGGVSESDDPLRNWSNRRHPNW